MEKQFHVRIEDVTPFVARVVIRHLDGQKDQRNDLWFQSVAADYDEDTAALEITAIPSAKANRRIAETAIKTALDTARYIEAA